MANSRVHDTTSKPSWQFRGPVTQKKAKLACEVDLDKILGFEKYASWHYQRSVTTKKAKLASSRVRYTKKSQVDKFKLFRYKIKANVSVREGGGGGGAVTAGAQSWGILARVVWQDEVGGHLGGQAWGMGVG